MNFNSLKSENVNEGIKKYFIYDNEIISGNTYFWRRLLQIVLIPLFGLGLYLQSVTVYKRAKSISPKSKYLHLWSIWGGLGIPILVLISLTSINIEISYVFVTLPHLYLWLTDRIKKEQNEEHIKEQTEKYIAEIKKNKEKN